MEYLDKETFSAARILGTFLTNFLSYLCTAVNLGISLLEILATRQSFISSCIGRLLPLNENWKGQQPRGEFVQEHSVEWKKIRIIRKKYGKKI